MRIVVLVGWSVARTMVGSVLHRENEPLNVKQQPGRGVAPFGTGPRDVNVAFVCLLFDVNVISDVVWFSGLCGVGGLGF